MPPESLAGDDILIVEDNQVNALILRTMLRKHGYEPRMARDGEEGVAMTARHRPRLVLMDLHMPRLDGFAAASAIRERMNGASPVLVAVTATATGDVEAACRDAGFSCVLPKPILIGDLVGMVRRYLD
ncbi:MAG: response regulator [Amaricoccus sp.]|uniref:response regulator n=1 Tax=Amaricoccus sp. TaxID=1872485 RepID=UPI0039E5C87B